MPTAMVHRDRHAERVMGTVVSIDVRGAKPAVASAAIARVVAWLHDAEASTLVTLGLVAAHAGVLLADGWLRPGLAGILLPFHLGYRPVWTGVGIIAGWVAAILGLSFYARRFIGVRTWRRLHRLTPLVYVLALAHVVGAGTGGHSGPMLALLAGLTAPVVFGLTYRLLPAPRPARPVAAR